MHHLKFLKAGFGLVLLTACRLNVERFPNQSQKLEFSIESVWMLCETILSKFGTHQEILEVSLFAFKLIARIAAVSWKIFFMH